MQAVHHVYFGQRLVTALSKLVPGLLERHRVGAWIAWLEARKRAEQTARHADVGRFETDVVVVVSTLAVAAFAFAIGQPAYGQEVRRLEKPDAIFENQTLAGVQLFGDVNETGGAQAGLDHGGIESFGHLVIWSFGH